MNHSVRLLLKIAIIVLLSLFVSASVSAAPDPTPDTGTGLFKDSAKFETNTDDTLKKSTSFSDIIWMLVRVIFALALIIVLIYFLIRFLSRKSGNFYTQRKLRVIAGIGLSPQKSMQIVEVGSRVYILGVGQDIQMIDRIDDPAEIESLIQSLETFYPDEQLLSGWKEKIGAWFKKKRVIEDDVELDPMQYEQLFSTHLKDATAREHTVEDWTEENKERSSES